MLAGEADLHWQVDGAIRVDFVDGDVWPLQERIRVERRIFLEPEDRAVAIVVSLPILLARDDALRAVD